MSVDMSMLSANNDFEKLMQVIPSEILNQLKEAARNKNINLNAEVIMRLYATFIEPITFGFSTQFDAIMNKKFTDAQVKLENEKRRRAWLILYELDKLKLLIGLEDKLPKNFKEQFILIDVEKESIRIREELKGEA